MATRHGERMSDDRTALTELLKVCKPKVAYLFQHYLYVASQEAAAQLGVQLRSRGFTTQERIAADGNSWLVLASHKIVPSEAAIAATRKLLEELVAPLSGEYDGWEADVR